MVSQPVTPHIYADRADLRQAVLRILGEFISLSTDSGSSATIVSSRLAESAGIDFSGWYVRITNGTYSGQIRRVSAYNGSDTLTMYAAFGGSIGSGVTFELSRIPSDWVDQEINSAISQLSQFLTQRRSAVLLTDEAIRNGGFDFWNSSGMPVDWNPVLGTPTKSTVRYSGQYSVGLSGAVATAIEQVLPVSLLTGQTITIEAWHRGLTNPGADLRIYHDNAVASVTGTNTGNWTKLTVSAAITTLRDLSVRLYIDGGHVAYIDSVSMTWPTALSNIYLPVSGAFPHSAVDLDRLTEPDYESDVNYILRSPSYDIPSHSLAVVDGIRYLRFESALMRSRKIVMSQETYLSPVAADGDMTEVTTDSKEFQLLAYHTAVLCANRAANAELLGLPDRWDQLAKRLVEKESLLTANWPHDIRQANLYSMGYHRPGWS